VTTKYIEEDIRGKGAHLGAGGEKDDHPAQPHGGRSAVENTDLLSRGIPGGEAESKGTGLAGALDPVV
jgi:hypothetical protein